MRFTILEQDVSLLYEKQSMTTIIRLLNQLYLIDIRHLDTRILSSNESEEMHLFFRYVASFMKKDYSHRWNSINDWLCTGAVRRSKDWGVCVWGDVEKFLKD